jgi:hypothetical protein
MMKQCGSKDFTHLVVSKVIDQGQATDVTKFISCLGKGELNWDKMFTDAVQGKKGDLLFALVDGGLLAREAFSQFCL